MEQRVYKATILITGASGFIGRHLVKYLCPEYRVIGFARRAQKEAGIPPHPNLEWVLIDLTDLDQLERAFNKVIKANALDYIFHLAAYYDFGKQVYSEIYEKTNILATQKLLELSQGLYLKRFIFSSSLVATKFPEVGERVNEQSQPYAEYPYAITKRRGEQLVRDAAQNFPCSIVRLAAVYSDWCEYEPLYHFLKTWLSRRWDSRILPGRGTMAIPYINVCCIMSLFDKIIEKSEELGNFNIFLASSDKPVSLNKIFKLATRFYYGQEIEPLYIPCFLAKMGVIFRNLRGQLTGKTPFEKLWMLEYLDRQFPTDCSYTRNMLDWQPKSRHELPRRLLHLVENMKAQPDEWHKKNIDRLYRFKRTRPALILAEEMVIMHQDLVGKVFQELMASQNSERLKSYQSMDSEALRWDINVLYNNLLTSVRHGDRSIMIIFARDLSMRRLNEKVSLEELCAALIIMRDVITQGLYNNPSLNKIRYLIHDYISLAIQLAIDEIKDVYENVPL